MKKIENIPTKENIVNLIEDIKNNFSNEKFVIINQFDVNHITEHKLKDLGIRMSKRLKRYFNNYVQKKNIHSANKCLWLISKHLLNLNNVMKITEPKHDEIQKLRKEWILLRDKADLALSTYKKQKVIITNKTNKKPLTLVKGFFIFNY